MPHLPFEYVPFGAAARAEAIACDGLVDGAALHASHWPGNRTPVELKADTSVEIALRALERGVPGDAIVTNNHFDADGVLAVFVLLEPEIAARHASLLVAAAEAGDFDEWPADDRGLRLEMAIRALAAGAAGDRDAYARTLAALPALVADVDARRDLWEQPFHALLAAERRAEEGAVRVSRQGDIAIFAHRRAEEELPGPVLARRAPAGVTRWLLAFEREGGAFEYRYERPRWAWADTVKRPRIAAPSRNAAAQDLGEGWALKGELGMTGILRTTRPVRRDPAEIAAALLRRDAGAQSAGKEERGDRGETQSQGDRSQERIASTVLTRKG
jgi:hypothetical protein